MNALKIYFLDIYKLFDRAVFEPTRHDHRLTVF
jgi:hypothetical protein